jgi:putative transcriptional regulator
MIKLRVLDLLKKKGKTKYWLYNQLNMSYQNFNRMVNNETKSIRYENLELLCEILECTPNELFYIE